MDKNDSTDRGELLAKTVAIVGAYASNNAVAAEELPALLQAVFTRLGALGPGSNAPVSVPTAAVAIRRSVTDAHIVCLEDGQKFASLKRHLMAAHAMTPEAYRQKWGLPRDYPMTAPAYTQKRRELAMASGLGRKPAPPPPKPKRPRRAKAG